jgi:hypothetical protein
MDGSTVFRMNKLLLIVATAIFVFSSDVLAELPPHLSMSCMSNSGMSQYDLNFSLPLKNGQIEYKFMEQDILYSVSLHEISESIITGRAKFQSSASGETRGTSFDFKYFPKTKRFEELNIEATCK